MTIAVRRATVALLAIVLAGVVAVPDGRLVERPTQSAASGPSPSLPDSPRMSVRTLGATDAGEVINFSLVLRMPGQAELDRYLAAVHDPNAPEYRRFLDAATIGERFGLADDELSRIRAWLASVGLEETVSFPQRTAIGVRGAASTVAELFGVSFVDRLDPLSDQVFHSPVGEPAVPSEIADVVDAVADLSNRPPASAYRRPGVLYQVPGGGMAPEDIAAAYNVGPVWDDGYLGEGQTVAVVSFDSYEEDDIDEFDEEFDINGPDVETIEVDGGIPGPGSFGALEVTLDISIVRAVAPEAQILNFEAQYETSQANVIDAIVADGRATIVTDSWGTCYADGYVSEGDIERGLDALETAALAGISVLVASGDWGAYDCWHFDPDDHRLTIDYPSGTAWTLSVGGTFLSVREDGTYLSEAGWEDYLSVGGTGGGLNPVEERPDWQHGPGVDNEFSNGMRQSPDVAAAADVDTGYQVYFTDPDTGDEGIVTVGGTSASSPFWAGVLALIAQRAEDEDVGQLGFVNPMLYDLAAEHEPNTIFHDVVEGGNLYHNATPGWDYATGLGSPDVALLADAVIEYLEERR